MDTSLVPREWSGDKGASSSPSPSKPLHLRWHRGKVDSLDTSVENQAIQTGINLPSGSDMTAEKVRSVCDSLKAVLQV